MSGPVTCQSCGEEWPRDPALEIACPVCQAPIGVACKRPSGYTLFGPCKVHAERDQAAMDAGIIQKCDRDLFGVPLARTGRAIGPMDTVVQPSLFGELEGTRLAQVEAKKLRERGSKYRGAEHRERA